jgi:hypothetical protein
MKGETKICRGSETVAWYQDRLADWPAELQEQDIDARWPQVWKGNGPGTEECKLFQDATKQRLSKTVTKNTIIYVVVNCKEWLQVLC